jgi:hypothetical protein
MGGVAAVFWLVALVLFVRVRVIGSQGRRVPGRVIGHSDYVSHRRRHRNVMYCAIYEATVDGRTLQCKSEMGTSWKSPPLGTVVTLLYRPDNLEQPLMALGFMRFLWCLVFAGVALVLTLSALSRIALLL